MVNQKSIIIGILVAIALYLIIGAPAYLVQIGLVPSYAVKIGMIISSCAPYLAVFIAALIVGYKVNQNFTNGAIHGSLVGVFTAIVLILLIMFRVGSTEKIGGLLIIIAVGLIGMSVLIGALGGLLGSLIKSKR